MREVFEQEFEAAKNHAKLRRAVAATSARKLLDYLLLAIVVGPIALAACYLFVQFLGEVVRYGAVFLGQDLNTSEGSVFQKAKEYFFYLYCIVFFLLGAGKVLELLGAVRTKARFRGELI